MKFYIRYPIVSILSLLLIGANYAHAQSAALPTETKEPKEAKVEELRIKDESVTIDELRIRGETKRVTVKPKNAPAYQIEPESGRKSIDDKTAGQRTWRLFTF